MSKGRVDGLRARIRQLTNDAAIRDDQVAKLEAELEQVHARLSGAESRQVEEAEKFQALKELALLLADIATDMDEFIFVLLHDLMISEQEKMVLGDLLSAAVDQILAEQTEKARKAAVEEENKKIAALMKNRNWVTDRVTLVVDGATLSLAPQWWERHTHSNMSGELTDTWSGTSRVAFNLPLYGHQSVEANVTRVEKHNPDGTIDITQKVVFTVVVGGKKTRFTITTDQWMRPDPYHFGHSWLEAQRCGFCNNCQEFHSWNQVPLIARFADA